MTLRNGARVQQRRGLALALQALLAQGLGQALLAGRHGLCGQHFVGRANIGQRRHLQPLAVGTGPVAEAAAVGTAAPDLLRQHVRRRPSSGDEQQGQDEALVHVPSPGSSARGGAGRGGLGRGGWAWMRASALSISPASSNSLACSDCSMAFSMASRWSGDGRLST